MEVMENLTKTCRFVFPLDGSSWMPCTAEPRCLAERCGVSGDGEAMGAVASSSENGGSITEIRWEVEILSEHM